MKIKQYPGPRLGVSNFGRDAPSFLMVAYYDPCGIATIYEYIGAWQQYSRFNVSVLNLWPNIAPLAMPASLRLEDFDGIVLHPSVSYFPENLNGLDRLLLTPFKHYEGVKILVKQDEHVRPQEFATFVACNAFDILVTCLPQGEVEKVYPRAVVGEIEIVHALTGFVAPGMRERYSLAMSGRPKDIVYRGSIQPLSTGKLGFEKRKIGYDVQRATAGRPLEVDISSRWGDRLTGEAWYSFLGQSKAVLGTESGSNLFDFDGAVERWCRDFTKQNSALDPESEAFYQRAHDAFLHRYEGNVTYAQISPRHFEAASTRSLQILYEGRYSDIFVAGRHYLALKRDLSNIDEVLDQALDDAVSARITDAAYEEIICDDRFTYEAFISRLDDRIALKLDGRGRPSHSKVHATPALALTDKPRALVVMTHEPTLDPRIDWMSSGLRASGFDVVELGCYEFSEVGSGPKLEELDSGHLRVRVERSRHDYEFLPTPTEIAAGTAVGQQQLLVILANLFLSDAALLRRVGAFDLDLDATTRFRSFCLHFVNTNSALLQAGRQIGQFDVVVGVDLDAMPAAQSLADDFGATLVYDAHEYWPHSIDGARHWERNFWGQIERVLAQQADIRVTVSPPLAERLTEDYMLPFLSVPNCEPLRSALPPKPREKPNDDVVFLFQGSLCKGRNLEALIQRWSGTDERAKLWLRGKDWTYKEELKKLAAGTGLLNSRIFFPEAVTEAQLVSAAAKADVGIIPYDPSNPGYKYACPNKFSQYMAAGLPILTTPLDYVAPIVKQGGLGRVFSFDGRPSLEDAVNHFVHDPESRNDCGYLSGRYFVQSFNWEAVSAGLYAEIRALAELRRTANIRPKKGLNLDWVTRGRTMRDFAIRGSFHNGAFVAAAAPAVPIPAPPREQEKLADNSPPEPQRRRSLLGQVVRRLPLATRQKVRDVLPSRVEGLIRKVL